MSSEFQFERRIDAKLLLSLLAAGLMSFTGVVIETAMNVTFPTLMQEFDIGISVVQWITTGYLLMLAVIIPLSAFLKARYAMRRLFFTASLLFLIGTLLGASANSFAMLLVGRLLQGVGTGIALPLMFNIVLEQAPLDRTGMMMGVASLICALAPAVGPSFGGWVVETFGWREIFLSLLPVLMLSFIAGMYAIRQSSALSRPSFDALSYVFLSLGFIALILATSFAGDDGWSNPKILALLAAFILLLAAFARRSRGSKSPLIRLSIFGDARFTLSVLAILLVQFITLGLGFLLPNFSQLVHGESPFTAGCILLPGCIVGAILAPFGGRMLDTYGARRPILFGCTLIALAALSFVLALPASTTLSLTAIYVVYTIGQGFAAGNIMTNGVRLLTSARQSDGNAVCNTLQQLAGAVGTAVVSSIVAAGQQTVPASLPDGTMTGSLNALYFLFACALFALIAMFIALKGTTRQN